jgi:hypothetical protein
VFNLSVQSGSREWPEWRSAGILAWRREGLKCADSRRSPVHAQDLRGSA